MKLRIRGNSLRLRLTQTEVKNIAEGQAVTESVFFGEQKKIQYKLETSGQVQSLSADFFSDTVLVLIPFSVALDWASSDVVSLTAEQDVGAGEKLHILVEKDFLCLKPRAQKEDETDMFANPNLDCGSCG